MIYKRFYRSIVRSFVRFTQCKINVFENGIGFCIRDIHTSADSIMDVQFFSRASILFHCFLTVLSKLY